MTNKNRVPHQTTGGTEQDESMGIVQNLEATRAHQGKTGTGPTHDMKFTPTNTTDEEVIYDDVYDFEQGGETVEFDAPWFTAALYKIESKWGESWTSPQDQLKKDAASNKSEMRNIREAQ